MPSPRSLDRRRSRRPRRPRRPGPEAGWGWWRVVAVAAVVLVGVAGSMGAVGAAWAAEAVPEPPLVVDGGATDGQVRLSPATQSTSDPRVTWVLANGGEGTLTFALAVHEVEASSEGVEIGDPSDLPLGADEVTLAPGELARIPLSLPSVDEPRALALVASTVDADPPTTLSGVVLVGGGGEVTPQVVDTDARAGTLTVRLDAEGPVLVDVALRATAWPGLAHNDEVVEGLYVPAGGRDLDLSLSGAVAGRVTVEVAVGGEAGARVTETVWWWPPALLGAVALVLVVGSAAVILLVARRRRGAG